MLCVKENQLLWIGQMKHPWRSIGKNVRHPSTVRNRKNNAEVEHALRKHKQLH